MAPDEFLHHIARHDSSLSQEEQRLNDYSELGLLQRASPPPPPPAPVSCLDGSPIDETNDNHAWLLLIEIYRNGGNHCAGGGNRLEELPEVISEWRKSNIGKPLRDLLIEKRAALGVGVGIGVGVGVGAGVGAGVGVDGTAKRRVISSEDQTESSPQLPRIYVADPTCDSGSGSGSGSADVEKQLQLRLRLLECQFEAACLRRQIGELEMSPSGLLASWPERRHWRLLGALLLPAVALMMKGKG